MSDDTSKQNSPEVVVDELRLALATCGAITLVVYESGVCHELERMMREFRQGRDPKTNKAGLWREIFEAAKLTPVIDVLTGASAGGINSVLLGSCLVSGNAFDPFRRVWIEGLDAGSMKHPSGTTPNAILYTDGIFQRARGHLETNAGEAANIRKKRPTSNLKIESSKTELDLRLCLTDYRGTCVSTLDSLGHRLDTTTKSHVVRFNHHHLSTPSLVGNAADAARATSAFPGLFDPVKINERWFVDGGLWNNQPIDLALDAIRDRKAFQRTRRVVLFIEPNPGRRAEEEPPAGDPPTMLENLLGITGMGLKGSILPAIESLLDKNRRYKGYLDALQLFPEGCLAEFCKEIQKETSAGELSLLDRVRFEQTILNGEGRRIQTFRSILAQLKSRGQQDYVERLWRWAASRLAEIGHDDLLRRAVRRVIAELNRSLENIGEEQTTVKFQLSPGQPLPIELEQVSDVKKALYAQLDQINLRLERFGNLRDAPLDATGNRIVANSGNRQITIDERGEPTRYVDSRPVERLNEDDARQPLRDVDRFLEELVRQLQSDRGKRGHDEAWSELIESRKQDVVDRRSFRNTRQNTSFSKDQPPQNPSSEGWVAKLLKRFKRRGTVSRGEEPVRFRTEDEDRWLARNFHDLTGDDAKESQFTFPIFSIPPRRADQPETPPSPRIDIGKSGLTFDVSVHCIDRAREVLAAVSDLEGWSALDLVRISPNDVNNHHLIGEQIGNHETAAQVKLACDGLGHVQGLFEARWRRNDYVWGRLDAAEILLRTVQRFTKVPMPEGVYDTLLIQLQNEILQSEAAECADLLPEKLCAFPRDKADGLAVRANRALIGWGRESVPDADEPRFATKLNGLVDAAQLSLNGSPKLAVSALNGLSRLSRVFAFLLSLTRPIWPKPYRFGSRVFGFACLAVIVALAYYMGLQRTIPSFMVSPLKAIGVQFQESKPPTFELTGPHLAAIAITALFLVCLGAGLGFDLWLAVPLCLLLGMIVGQGNFTDWRATIRTLPTWAQVGLGSMLAYTLLKRIARPVANLGVKASHTLQKYIVLPARRAAQWVASPFVDGWHRAKAKLYSWF